MYYDFWINEDGNLVFFSNDPDMVRDELTNMFQFIGPKSKTPSRQMVKALEIVDDPLDAEELKHLAEKVINRKKGVSGIANELFDGWEVTHPVDGHSDKLTNVVISLNDVHKWTREQIADWLDTLPTQPKIGGNNA